VATLIILLVSQADFSQSTPRHGGNLLVAALLVLGLAALGTRLSRGAKQSCFLITDRRVVVVRPLVVRVAWVRQPRVVEVPLAELPPAEAATMPLCFGYGNVYFGRPGSWWIAPGGVHLGYLPVLNLEFYAIPDPAAVAQLANGLRTGTRRTEWRA
jgi:hypothetical protein